MVDEGTGDFDEVGIREECVKSRLCPELAANVGECIGERGEGLGVPGGLTNWWGWVGMGERRTGHGRAT